MSKIAAKRIFIALKTDGERERRLSAIRVARWSGCHLCYGHKRGHIGAWTLLYLIAVEPNICLSRCSKLFYSIIRYLPHFLSAHLCFLFICHYARTAPSNNKHICTKIKHVKYLNQSLNTYLYKKAEHTDYRYTPLH